MMNQAPGATLTSCLSCAQPGKPLLLCPQVYQPDKSFSDVVSELAFLTQPVILAMKMLRYFVCV